MTLDDVPYFVWLFLGAIAISTVFGGLATIAARLNGWAEANPGHRLARAAARAARACETIILIAVVGAVVGYFAHACTSAPRPGADDCGAAPGPRGVDIEC